MTPVETIVLAYMPVERSADADVVPAAVVSQGDGVDLVVADWPVRVDVGPVAVALGRAVYACQARKREPGPGWRYCACIASGLSGPGGLPDKAEAVAVDATGGVGHHHRGGASVRGEPSEGAEAPGSAVVPDHAWPPRLLENDPAQPDLHVTPYPCLGLLRESQRSSDGAVGWPQAGGEEAEHVFDAGSQAACGGHEVLDRWARMSAT